MSTPFDSKVHLFKNCGDSVSQDKYAQIIGSLMFLTNCTRLDIAYAVGRLSRYTHHPKIEHQDAISRLLRYLKGTFDYGLLYCDYPTILKGYCDANWIFDTDEVSPLVDMCSHQLEGLSLGSHPSRLAQQDPPWNQSQQPQRRLGLKLSGLGVW